MGSRELNTLLEGGHFFEAPRWHDGRWWISDFYSYTVQTVDADGNAETVLEVEGQPSGLGWMPDGALLVISMTDHTILRRGDTGAVTVHADLTEHCGGHLNDMVVDEAGRAYVGNFGWDLMGGEAPRAAVLVRVEPDGSASVFADDLVFPNGSVITPDGGTLIVAETFAGRLQRLRHRNAASGRSGRSAPRCRSGRSRRCCRSRRSPRTASRSMPRATCGRPTASPGACAGSRPAARSSRRSRCPRASASSPASSAATTAGRC